MVRSFLYGFIFNLQFFTTIPIKGIQVPLDRESLRRSVQLFPLLGLLQGLLFSLLAYILYTWTSLSPLVLTLVLWLFPILFTGGLHLDGWIDSSDAYFSYRDKKRRIEILADPAVGAFGLLSVIVLLVLRFVFLYEIVKKLVPASFVLFLLVPFFSRVSMNMFITFIPPLKDEGLGRMFHQASHPNILLYNGGFILLLYLFLYLYEPSLLIVGLLFFLAMLLAYLVIKRKIVTAFGGINGDLAGGATEGMETILWLLLWVYHYYVMG